MIKAYWYKESIILTLYNNLWVHIHWQIYVWKKYMPIYTFAYMLILFLSLNSGVSFGNLCGTATMVQK